MSFLSRTQGKGEAKARPTTASKTGDEIAGMDSRYQTRKRITQPLADLAFVGEILSQTRAARKKRIPPDPM